MGKKTGKKAGKGSKKNRKNQFAFKKLLEKFKSLNKKTKITILCVICGIILIAATCTGVHIIKKLRADRTVSIAFYGLSEEMCTMLKEIIPQEEKIILDFDIIPEGDFDTVFAKKKYDMLFTWRGEITDSLSASAEEIPSRILESIPRSLRNKKCVPIILDCCEFDYSTAVMKKLKNGIPQSYDSFQGFLQQAKGVVFSPVYCNGGEDRILIDLIGALVMAQGGLSAYNRLIEGLRKTESVDSMLDVKLDGKALTLRALLDMIKAWPEEGLTNKAWYNGRGNDLVYFADSKQLGCFFTTLSEHRKIPYNVIKNYESDRIPTNQQAGNYGLIAPAVSCMLLTDNSNARRYITNFFTEEVQGRLSDKTCLGPVHYQAPAYDRQADDVRFWAASCAGGAVPDLYLAVYQRKPEELKKICGEIRDYVR